MEEIREFAGLTLDGFQVEAVTALSSGHNVIVGAPTGTGKTLIADYLVDCVLRRGTGVVVFTAPIKALSNQKFRSYRKKYGEENVGLVTGDMVINRHAPLQVMTTEILRNILLTDDKRSIEKLEAVIFDEFHFLGDRGRGSIYEETLMYLPARVQVLGLSATLSNMDELAEWIDSIKGQKTKVVTCEKRAVPLSFFVGSREGIFPVESHRQKMRALARKKKRGRAKKELKEFWGGKSGKKPGKVERSTHRDIIRQVDEKDLPLLYFKFSRTQVEKSAKSFARRKGRSYLKKFEVSAVRGWLDDFERDHPEVLGSDLRVLLLRGIGFHHAGLAIPLKRLVEQMFEGRLIKILFSTSTFALGVNAPCRTTVLDKLEKFNGEEIAPLTVRQFMQKAGRAGRRGLDPYGKVIIRMDPDEWAKMGGHMNYLMEGNSEPVESGFSMSLHTICNLLKRGFTRDKIKEILSTSFFAHQERMAWNDEDRKLEEDIDKASMIVNPSEGEEAIIRSVVERAKAAEVRVAGLSEDLDRKMAFLREYKYITADDELAICGKLMTHIQIQEVLMVELIQEGVFDSIEPEDAFALCAGIVADLGRKPSVSMRPDEELRELLEGVVYELLGSKCLAQANEFVDEEAHVDSRMVTLAYEWAHGATFKELLSLISTDTDCSSDVINGLRRAKDLLGQVADAMPFRAKEFHALCQDITREDMAYM